MQNTYINTLSANHELVLAWTMRIIRARYKQSVLGILWAVIQPIASAIILSVIFTVFVPVDTGNVPYLVFSYTAMVPWVFFSSALTDMVDSLVNNSQLVSKIYFSREVLPMAAMLARLLDFAIAIAILVVLLIYNRMPFAQSWFYLPLVLLIQIALTLGLGLAGAALNVYYRDIKHVLVLGLQLWFYATPIIYPVSAVPEWLRPFYFLNPMAGIISAYRAIILNQALPDSSLLLSAISALVLFILGYWFFKKTEHHFADII